MASPEPILPAWDRGCITDVVPALLGDGPRPEVLPEAAQQAGAVVLLLLDGLGWEQLKARPKVAPTLNELHGSVITTVVPSTTAVALTSLVTGAAPGRHGMVGYRMAVGDEVLNALSWRTSRGDARNEIVPEDFTEVVPFADTCPVVVQNAPFLGSGFSRAYLRNTRAAPWPTPACLVVEVRAALSAAEPFVYAYYDGLDKVAHVHGFDARYDAELAACDRLVAELMSDLPRGAVLVVTGDHGLVDCSEGRCEIDKALKPLVAGESGEARFRWLHARPGRARELGEAAAEAHGEQAWVATIEQILDEGWFGHSVSYKARQRLGDVALAAKADWWFDERSEEDRKKRKQLVGRHGSLTSAEMLVPLLTFAA